MLIALVNVAEKVSVSIYSVNCNFIDLNFNQAI